MSLTREDYIILAEAIADVIIKLQTNNPDFDSDKFIDRIKKEVKKDGDS